MNFVYRPQGLKFQQYDESFREKTEKFLADILEGEYGFKIGVDIDDDVVNIWEHYLGDGGDFWIALLDGEIVGTLGLEKGEEGRSCLRRFLVKNGMRRKGIGRKLFDVLMDSARKLGFKEVYVSTVSGMEEGKAFYEKFGFERVDRMPPEMPRTLDTEFFRLIL